MTRGRSSETSTPEAPGSVSPRRAHGTEDERGSVGKLPPHLCTVIRMNSDRNIINIIDKWDAKVTDWLDEKYPTAIYHFVVGLFGFAVLVGIFAIVKAHLTDNLFDLVFGLALLVGSTIGGTLATVWARNNIEALRQKSRKYHPSYPY